MSSAILLLFRFLFVFGGTVLEAGRRRKATQLSHRTVEA